MKIGALTIGQSPRVDIIPELQDILGPRLEITEKGALDSLDLEDVKELWPQPSDYALVTRMRDGTEVKVAIRHILERMRNCVLDFEKEEVELIILLCTGEFPGLESKKIILRPDAIMLHVVQGLLDRGKLGVIVPASDQRDLKKKWECTGLQIIAEAVSPYTGTDQDLREKAHEIGGADVDLIVLDCLGFGRKAKAIFREITGKPVLLPRTVLGRMAKEIVGE